MRVTASLPSLLLTALAVCTSALHGQKGASLRITVQAIDDARPLAGVQVLVQPSGVWSITGDDGVAWIREIPEGTLEVEASFLGFVPWSQPVSFRPGYTTNVVAELAVDTIGLPPVEVEAGRSTLINRGFYDRKRAGSGTFFTRDDIESMQLRHLSDLLRRVGGINVGGSSRGYPSATVRGQQTIVGACPIQYFVDGVLTAYFNIDEIRSNDVEGIEIYRGAASIPADFKRGTATCGVILVWTRVG